MSKTQNAYFLCWPGIEHPFTLDELDDHDMRTKHCEQILRDMSEEERIATNSPEGWSAFLKEHWDYNPEGYVKPVVTKEQREEWRKNQVKKKFYIVDRKSA